MKAYRDGIRKRAKALGRNPDDIKVLFLAHPIIDSTIEAARERQRREAAAAEEHVEMVLSSMSRLTGIDFAQFDFGQADRKSTRLNSSHMSISYAVFCLKKKKKKNKQKRYS